MASADDIEQLEQDANAAQDAAEATPTSVAAAPGTTDTPSPLGPQPLSFGESLMPSVMNPENSSSEVLAPNDLSISDKSDGSQPASSDSSDMQSDDKDQSDDSKDDSSSLAPKPEFDAAHTQLMSPVAAQPQSQMSQAIDSAIQNPDVRQYMKDKYGFGSELDDAALKAAQDNARRKQMVVGILQGGDEIGKGFAQLGAGPDFQKIQSDPTLLNEAMKQAQMPVENLLARRQGMLQNQQLGQDQMKGQMMQSQLQSELALNDPNSQESKAAQIAYLPILQKAGLPTDLLQNASASTIKTVLQNPLEFADRQKQAELMAQNSADLKKIQLQGIQAQRDSTNAYKQIALKQHEDQQDFNQTTAINKQLDSFSQSSRNSLGQAARTQVAAQRVKDILSNPNATPQDLAAAASDVSQMTALNPSANGAKDQQYHTLAGDFAKSWQYITSNPQAADVPQVKQHMLDLTNRMSGISGNVIAAQTRGIKAAYPDFEQRHPGRIDSIAAGYALNPPTQQPGANSTGSNSPSAGPSPTPSSQQITPDVLNYAQAHGITPDQALQIKLQRTQGQQ